MAIKKDGSMVIHGTIFFCCYPCDKKQCATLIPYPDIVRPLKRALLWVEEVPTRARPSLEE